MIEFEKEDFAKVQTKDEKNLEKRVLNILNNDMGIWAKKINCTVDGFPDIMICMGRTFLLELKSFEYKRDKKLKSIFKPSQPPFYYDYCLKTLTQNLFVLFEAIKSNEKIYYLVKVDSYTAKKLLSITFNDLLAEGKNFTMNLKKYTSLVKAIKDIFSR